MDEQLFDRLLSCLRGADWEVALYDPIQELLPDALRVRYPAVPSSYASFLKRLARCVNHSQTVWFLCREDFEGQSGAAFTWNEWEAQGLEQAKGSSLAAQSTVSFWNDHLPFMTSVKAGYAYLALNITPRNFGAVVAGYEPALEEPEFVCDSFEDLLQLLCEDLQRAPGERLLKHFS
jgi:hypothetical protein